MLRIENALKGKEASRRSLKGAKKQQNVCMYVVMGKQMMHKILSDALVRAVNLHRAVSK